MSAKPKPAPTVAGALLANDDAGLVAKASAFAAPYLRNVVRADGQDALDHAQATAAILMAVAAPPSVVAAAYLAEAVRVDGEVMARVETSFGSSVASLVEGARRLDAMEDTARASQPVDTALGHSASGNASLGGATGRTERLRRMLLAFSRDLRGVLLHLASRLQVLRWHAQRGLPVPQPLARDAMDLLAPLANRLGVWSMKWELEDLAFRALEPQAHHDIARKLDASRDARLREVGRFRQQVADALERQGIGAEVQGRAKHLYSIWRKMQGKQLAFEHVHDLQALRVVVDSVADCYAVLACLQSRWTSVPGEFDDYIARPKANGYQSLHMVVLDDAGRAVEVQIRTRVMHDHAEHGVAAHWAYKEAGTRGYAGASVAADDALRVLGARKAMLHQLLAWERDVAAGDAAAAPPDRVYVFTPQGAVIDLPIGATAIDFAYAVHTTMGHRCRGAKVDGALVPLNTPLRNGQSVEVMCAKEGGPSLDWLNSDLGYLASPRSKAKVRAWFNAQAHDTTVAQGRERLERLLQRLGRTATKHAEVASRLKLHDPEALYTALGKDELPLRDIEALWHEPEPVPDDDEALARRLVQAGAARKREAKGDVLVVGVDSLLTGLARCCRPAPPDGIGGFVTRHKGVAIHRRSCTNFIHMAERSPQRVIAVAWGAQREGESRFAVDVMVEALDRPGLLRDITEVFAKDRLNVIGVHSQTLRDARGSMAQMLFTVEVARTDNLAGVLAQLAKVQGVRQARRR